MPILLLAVKRRPALARSGVADVQKAGAKEITLVEFARD
jgi:hypothetical protein